MAEFEKLKSVVKEKKIILFGPPGSGKGNRSNDLKALGLVHVSSGISLRAKVRDDPDPDLAKRANSYMKRGDLVPDEIVVPIVMEHLNQDEVMEKGFVLDGFPRNRSQAEVLFSQIEPDLILYLDVPRKFLVYGVVEGNRRVCVDCAKGYSDFDPPVTEGKCNECGGSLVNRVDDNIQTIENRLNLYDEETRSILPFLESKGIVEVLPITVGDDEDVDEALLKKLRGEVYWVETDAGGKARMLNLLGMRERLYNLLAEKFMNQEI